MDHPNPPFQRVTWPDWLAFSDPYSSATLTPCRPIAASTPKQRCPVPQSEAAALSQGLDEGQYSHNTNTDTRRSASTHAETAAIDSDAPWPWDGLAPSQMCVLQAMPCARHRASHPRLRHCLPINQHPSCCSSSRLEICRWPAQPPSPPFNGLNALPRL